MTNLEMGKPHGRLRIVVLGSGDRRPAILDNIDALREMLTAQHDVVAEDLHFEQGLFADSQFATTVDLAVVVGGDGSILRAARYMGEHQIPVLGVNLGKLGFLAGIPPEQLPMALQSLSDGSFKLVNHLMMRCQLIQSGKVTHDELGLNEVAVLSGPPFAMQYIDLYVDGHLATSYSCDGMLISTPVGSTAHNLSAGGPILRTDLMAFVISPINPHTLTVRPVVDSADRTLELVVTTEESGATAVLDGQVLAPMRQGDRVQVTRADQVFQTVQVRGQNYYQTLREKLGWRGAFQKNGK